MTPTFCRENSRQQPSCFWSVHFSFGGLKTLVSLRSPEPCRGAYIKTIAFLYGCGSKNRCHTGTRVSGNMDQNLRLLFNFEPHLFFSPVLPGKLTFPKRNVPLWSFSHWTSWQFRPGSEFTTIGIQGKPMSLFRFYQGHAKDAGLWHLGSTNSLALHKT